MRVENLASAVVLEGNIHLAVGLVVAVMNEDTAEEVAMRTGDTDDEECTASRDGGVDAVLDTAEDGDELEVKALDDYTLKD